MSLTPHIETLPFETDAGLGQKARIGLIILQTDQTIEDEFASLLRGEGVALYHTRIPNAMNVTPETLSEMEQDLPEAAALLPERFGFDAIGYCCTSGSTMIGEARVDRIIRKVHPKAKTSNPLSACKAALAALGLKRVALITPYAPAVTIELQKSLQAVGVEINAVAAFNQSDDFIVARITSQSILAAIKTVGMRDDCDGVFVACTSLRVLPVIAMAEASIGKPVMSSNQVLAWHLMQLAGVEIRRENAGLLLGKTLAEQG